MSSFLLSQRSNPTVDALEVPRASLPPRSTAADKGPLSVLLVSLLMVILQEMVLLFVGVKQVIKQGTFVLNWPLFRGYFFGFHLCRRLAARSTSAINFMYTYAQ